MQEEAEIMQMLVMGLPMREIVSARHQQIAARDARYAALWRPGTESEDPDPEPAAAVRHSVPTVATPAASPRKVADDAVVMWASATASRRGSAPAHFARPVSVAPQRWWVATHEAGHVVAALALGCVVPSAYISAESDRGNTEIDNPTASALVAVATVFAGGTAERMFTAPLFDPFGPKGSAGNDLKLIRDQFGPARSDETLGRLAAERILTENAPAVERVAWLLADRGYATGAQLVAAAGTVKRFPGA